MCGTDGGFFSVQAHRTKDTVPLVQEAERAILLSGTPALARPRELLPQLQALLPTAKLRLADYGSRYCASPTNRFNPAWGKYEGPSRVLSLFEEKCLVRFHPRLSS